MIYSSNNVIQFPSLNKAPLIVDPPSTQEEVDEAVEMIRRNHIQDTLETVIPILFDNLSVAGFRPSDENDALLKDGAFVVESIRSLLHKMYAIHHPLQIVADGLFEYSEDEDSHLKVSNKIKIIVTENESGGSA